MIRHKWKPRYAWKCKDDRTAYFFGDFFTKNGRRRARKRHEQIQKQAREKEKQEYKQLLKLKYKQAKEETKRNRLDADRDICEANIFTG